MMLVAKGKRVAVCAHPADALCAIRAGRLPSGRHVPTGTVVVSVRTGERLAAAWRANGTQGN